MKLLADISTDAPCAINPLTDSTYELTPSYSEGVVARGVTGGYGGYGGYGGGLGLPSDSHASIGMSIAESNVLKISEVVEGALLEKFEGSLIGELILF